MRHARTLALTGAALHAALFAAQTDAGSSGAASETPDPVNTTDPAPHPQTADQVVPAQPQTDPAPNASGHAQGADPNPPVNAEQAAAVAKDAEKPAKGKAGKGSKTSKSKASDDDTDYGDVAYVVWAQPGHETIGIGQLLRTTADEAEALRAAGRARYASESEVASNGENALDLAGI